MRVSNHIDIRRPLPEVYAYAADLNNYALWASGVLELRPDTERLGRFRMRRRVPGRDLHVEFRLVEMVPDARLVLEGLSAGVPWRSTLTFAQRDGRTRVSDVLDIGLSGVRRVAAPVLIRLLSEVDRMDLENLKHQLEEPVPQRSICS